MVAWLHGSTTAWTGVVLQTGQKWQPPGRDGSVVIVHGSGVRGRFHHGVTPSSFAAERCWSGGRRPWGKLLRFEGGSVRRGSCAGRFSCREVLPGLQHTCAYICEEDPIILTPQVFEKMPLKKYQSNYSWFSMRNFPKTRKLIRKMGLKEMIYTSGNRWERQCSVHMQYSDLLGGGMKPLRLVGGQLRQDPSLLHSLTWAHSSLTGDLFRFLSTWPSASRRLIVSCSVPGGLPCGPCGLLVLRRSLSIRCGLPFLSIVVSFSWLWHLLPLVLCRRDRCSVLMSALQSPLTITDLLCSALRSRLLSCRWCDHTVTVHPENFCTGLLLLAATSLWSS
ncbi:hypothetical protein KSP40_PGU007568 [Platanthera guangdongensis]|uniref:Uncharacterized protein n=1 Tax=Platanthera guangdongensis TaxID=2320717 RepID=A0ABR2LQG6_9ASPA